jgi:hypothetical protein
MTTKIGAVLFLVMLTTMHALASQNDPLVNSASINTATNTLTISGANLLGADGLGPASVTLGRAPGIILSVTSSSATSINATFPSGTPASGLAPNTYLLTVVYHDGYQAMLNINVGGGPIQSTTLVFPFLTNMAGFETGIAISNVSVDSSSQGICMLNWFEDGGQNPPPTTWKISRVYASILTSIIAGGFQGYMVAHCNFNAQGFALISDNAAQLGMTGYLAITSNP